jgi:hypothetical protein
MLYTEAINALEFCRDAFSAIHRNERVIRRLEDAYSTLGATALDGMPRGGRYESRSTEAAALHIPASAHRTIEELTRENERIERLYRAITAELAKIPYPQRSILDNFYIDGRSWTYIAQRRNYSERQCQRLRDDGIAELHALLALNPEAKIFFTA